MNIAYKTTKNLPPKQLHKIFVAVGWSDGGETPEMIETGYTTPWMNSTLVISAWDGERLVGAVRVLSDTMFRSSIYDLLVLPEYQSRGIGSELVKRCIEHYPNSEWLV
jgi:ribosomal protein S18 acetylase RimI-like enzyme